MTAPRHENTANTPATESGTDERDPDLEITAYSVPPADDPDNSEEGPRGE
ncbi:MAG TPA: hypothetical protein VK083_14445 [Nocardia sp.]|nr:MULTISPECIES: hypothetical protein [Nocardia]HLS77980.1 hypothetical protein [Nocardia sp.]